MYPVVRIDYKAYPLVMSSYRHLRLCRLFQEREEGGRIVLGLMRLRIKLASIFVLFAFAISHYLLWVQG
ncbi:hypothetical protein BC936DRAFT_148075 [Jimgerdemannia flammicorona]|uniref:Uncharacterized protein n=1 Tax=Jimgerdemannia flammicorona TaxID=994334 RepID=A0A433D3X0_9FUNG|nr:hypothetical protein BC936DRAFT_148075 [Jimgerdemannia flammicorona]